VSWGRPVVFGGAASRTRGVASAARARGRSRSSTRSTGSSPHTSRSSIASRRVGDEEVLPSACDDGSMVDETRGDEPLGGETTRPHDRRSGEMHGDAAQGRQRHHDGASSSGERGEEAAALLEAAGAALEYLRVVPDRRVFPTEQALTALSAFDEPLPDRPGDPTQTVRFLHELGSPATVASNGPS